jgi:hypothetical protein
MTATACVPAWGTLIGVMKNHKKVTVAQKQT